MSSPNTEVRSRFRGAGYYASGTPSCRNSFLVVSGRSTLRSYYQEVVDGGPLGFGRKWSGGELPSRSWQEEGSGQTIGSCCGTLNLCGLLAKRGARTSAVRTEGTRTSLSFGSPGFVRCFWSWISCNGPSGPFILPVVGEDGAAGLCACLFSNFRLPF